MWYALTAHQKKRSSKEIKKEFSAAQYEIILAADTQDDLNLKLNESINKFPKEMEKYLRAGIKIVEAENSAQAKTRAARENKYFDQRGQYSIL